MSTGRKVRQYLAMEKTKSIVAVSLVSLMVFMWVRVLSDSDKSNKAEAANSATETTATQKTGQVSVRYVKLPVVKGRNDKLVRDFFSTDTESGGKDMKVVDKSDNPDQDRRDAIMRLAEKVQLEVIAVAGHSQALIGGKLVCEGDSFDLEDKGQVYKFEVVRIDENEVVLRCEDVRLEVKMLSEIDAAESAQW